MKRTLLILLAAIAALAAPMVPQAKAVDFSISVGDRPYYHGGGYWHEGYYWAWVPGHYSHRWHRWVPGHYVRRGVYDARHAHVRFRQHRVWVNDNNWR